MSWGSASHRWAPSGRARRARDSCWQLSPRGPARCGPTSVPPPALPLLAPGHGQAPQQSRAMGPRLWERAPQEQSLEKRAQGRALSQRAGGMAPGWGQLPRHQPRCPCHRDGLQHGSLPSAKQCPVRPTCSLLAMPPAVPDITCEGTAGPP